jgi:hypothetical protein
LRREGTATTKKREGTIIKRKTHDGLLLPHQELHIEADAVQKHQEMPAIAAAIRPDIFDLTVSKNFGVVFPHKSLSYCSGTLNC